jgi:hypothetical protein
MRNLHLPCLLEKQEIWIGNLQGWRILPHFLPMQPVWKLQKPRRMHIIERMKQGANASLYAMRTSENDGKALVLLYCQSLAVQSMPRSFNRMANFVFICSTFIKATIQCPKEASKYQPYATSRIIPTTNRANSLLT